MKIAIIGYGKMGHEIERLAAEEGCEVVAIIDNANDWQQHLGRLQQANVAIEFTAPHIVTENLKKLFDLGIPVVTGTTGWLDQLDQITTICNNSNGTLLYASNFSIGVNLFFALNRYLAQLMKSYQYRASLEETHHTQKLDSPSGTAVSMINDILEQNDHIKGWSFASENNIEEEIAVTAHRIEGVTGIHKMIYTSAIDSISIEHNAFNREGFARGALQAARWLEGKRGVFTMKDFLKL